MEPLNVAGLASAMAGYNPPQTAQASTGSSNPLTGIIGTALNILPFVAPEIGIPARMALGAVTTGASNALEGKPFNLGQDLLGGVSDGMMGGMMGGAGKAVAADVADAAGKDIAANAGSDLADNAVTDATGAAATTPTEPRFIVDQQGNVINSDNPNLAPTNIDPESGQGHVNLTQDPVTGEVKADTNNTFTSPATPTGAETPPGTQLNLAPTPEEPVTVTPRTGVDATSRYTPQAANTTPQLNGLQQGLSNEKLKGMTTTMLGSGMKLPADVMNHLGNQALTLGYKDYPTMARDAQTLTGQDYGVDNAVNNMVKQAAVGDSVANPTTIDVTDLTGDNNRNSFVNQATRGTTGKSSGGVAYTNAQRKIFNNAIQDQNPTLAGAGANGYRTIDEAVAAGDLIKSPTGGYELTSQGMKNANPVDVLQTQRNFASSAVKAQSQGEKNLYNGLSVALKDKLGQIAITPEGTQNVLSNLQESGFADSNPTQYAALQKGLSDGTISTVNQLRSFTAPWVEASQAYSKATGGASIYDLAAGGRGGLSKNVMNSVTAGKVRVKVADALSKFTAKPGEASAYNPSGGSSTGGTVTNTGGTMSPAGKTAVLAGIISALGLGGNALATHNQASQANAELNNPQYQQTQNILNQSNALQRYLGQEGEIRSVFAPTFDTNAGEAGTMGQTLLANANQNQAARTAAANLLAARSQMGLGGILGGIAGLIPGTSQNTYKNQAANAQAQLNALGVAGSASSVAQGGASIPSLTSMAGNVGNF